MPPPDSTHPALLPPRPVPAAAFALPWAVLGGGCAAQGALAAPPGLGALIGLLAAAVAVNVAATAALLLAWGRLSHRRHLREALRRELRHLGPAAGEEAVLRKAGLLRDLNALGDVPGDLDGCVLTGAGLQGVRLTGCSLRGAHLAGAQLQGAALDGADLFGAELTGANLALAGLRGANLRGCALSGASLVKAALPGANLHRAELVDTDLHGADIRGARLSLARFARPVAAPLQLTVHPSVDDWIRARLDEQGRYREDGPEPARRREAG